MKRKESTHPDCPHTPKKRRPDEEPSPTSAFNCDDGTAPLPPRHENTKVHNSGDASYKDNGDADERDDASNSLHDTDQDGADAKMKEDAEDDNSDSDDKNDSSSNDKGKRKKRRRRRRRKKPGKMTLRKPIPDWRCAYCGTLTTEDEREKRCKQMKRWACLLSRGGQTGRKSQQGEQDNFYAASNPKGEYCYSAHRLFTGAPICYFCRFPMPSSPLAASTPPPALAAAAASATPPFHPPNSINNRPFQKRKTGSLYAKVLNICFLKAMIKAKKEAEEKRERLEKERVAEEICKLEGISSELTN